MANLVGLALADGERSKLLSKAARNLWWFATEVLGRDRLTVDFHKPMLDAIDDRRRARRRGEYLLNEGEMWPRDYYKTTVREAELARDFLVDPTLTVVWWHAIDVKAEEAVANIGRYFQENKVLRRMRPDMMPAVNARKWASANGFRFVANRDRAPSAVGKGAGSEATGHHCRVGILDDIIGLNDIEDNAMPKKRSWFGQTVMNVVSTRGGLLRMTGTHWDQNDIYVDWRRSSRWDIRVRACYELDGVADWNGDPVLYTRAEIENKRSSMSSYEFAAQMMNDPVPAHERLWVADACEQFIDVDDAIGGQGRVFVLSDEAPAQVGSQSQTKERERRDGSKDWWSLAVVKVRVRGQRQEIILLDGRHSQDWTRREGVRHALDLAVKWSTNLVYFEDREFTEDVIAVAKEVGAHPYLDDDGRVLSYADKYAHHAKNRRIEALADRAKRGELLIARSVPGEFLYGDGDVTGVLTQARAYRPTTKGNTLRWDDDIDVVARATDTALTRFAPRVVTAEVENELAPWSPYTRPVREDSAYQSRYFKW